jgi:hypothetical protein
MRLSDLLQRGLSGPPRPVVAAAPRLAQIVARVDALLPEEPRAQRGDPREACRLAARRFAEDRWPCSQRDIAAAILPAFTAPCRDDAAFDALRAALLRECAATDRAALLSRFAEAYLWGYAAGDVITAGLAAALGRAASFLPPRWAGVFAALPLLAPDAAQRIAARIADAPDPHAALVAQGLRMREGGMIGAVQTALLERWRPGLRMADGATLDRLLDWLRAGGRRRETGAAEALGAMLGPWSGTAPPPAHRDALVRAVIDLHGDPRTADGGPWAQLRQSHAGAYAALLRWLARETLELFIGILEQAEAGRHGDMFERRKEFWRSLIRREVIADSTVALSPWARRHALDARRSRPGLKNLHWATQTQRGYQRSDTSIIVMRIHNYIVVEGSHSFPVLIFSSRSDAAPRLHLPAYDCQHHRRDAGLSGVAVVPHIGSWDWTVLRTLGL